MIPYRRASAGPSPPDGDLEKGDIDAADLKLEIAQPVEEAEGNGLRFRPQTF